MNTCPFCEFVAMDLSSVVDHAEAAHVDQCKSLVSKSALRRVIANNAKLSEV